MTTVNIPKKAPDRRAWIKYQLELKGWSLSALSKKHGYTRSAVQQALDRPYPKVEKIVASTLGMSVEQLWPERYPEVKATRAVDVRQPKRTRSVGGNTSHRKQRKRSHA